MGLQVVSSTICQIPPLKRVYIFRYLFIGNYHSTRQKIKRPAQVLRKS